MENNLLSVQNDAEKNKTHYCPICNKAFTRVDSLTRHKKRVHNGLEFNSCELSDEEDDQPLSENSSQTTTVTKPLLFPAVQTKLGGSYFRPETMDLKEASTYEAFKQYMLSDKAGGGSKSTSNGYAGKVRNFLQHCRNTLGISNAYFHVLATVGTASKEDFVSPPDLQPFLNTCVSDWVRKYTVCAYIKLLRWLKDDLLHKEMLNLPPEEFHRRNWCLDSILTSSDMLLRSLNKKGARSANGATTVASANAVDSPTLSELEALVVAYKTSTARLVLVEASQNVDLYLTKGAKVWNKTERSPYFLRNFLMLELLVLNGSRPGAICNATLGEFESSRLLRDSSGYFMSVRRHKTSKSSGHDTLIMKHWLHTAICQYIRYARPHVLSRSCAVDDSSLQLFPSSRQVACDPGKRSFKGSIHIFFELANRRPDPRICATSFRSFHVGLGQLSQDPAIRSELPALMGHSLKTAVSVYFRDEAKAARRSCYQKTLLDLAGAVTPPWEGEFPKGEGSGSTDEPILKDHRDFGDKPDQLQSLEAKKEVAGKYEATISGNSVTLSQPPWTIQTSNFDWKTLIPPQHHELIWRSFDKEEGPNLLSSLIDKKCIEIPELADLHWELWDKLVQQGDSFSRQKMIELRAQIRKIIRACHRSRFNPSECEGWNQQGIVRAFSALKQLQFDREDVEKLMNFSEDFRETFEGVRHQLAHPQEAPVNPGPEELKRVGDYIVESYREYLRYNPVENA